MRGARGAGPNFIPYEVIEVWKPVGRQGAWGRNFIRYEVCAYKNIVHTQRVDKASITKRLGTHENTRKREIHARLGVRRYEKRASIIIMFV